MLRLVVAAVDTAYRFPSVEPKKAKALALVTAGAE